MDNLAGSFEEKSKINEYYKKIYLAEIESKWNISSSELKNGTSTNFIYKVRNKLFADSEIKYINPSTQVESI